MPLVFPPFPELLLPLLLLLNPSASRSGTPEGVVFVVGEEETTTRLDDEWGMFRTPSVRAPTTARRPGRTSIWEDTPDRLLLRSWDCWFEFSITCESWFCWGDAWELGVTSWVVTSWFSCCCCWRRCSCWFVTMGEKVRVKLVVYLFCLLDLVITYQLAVEHQAPLLVSHG